MVAGAGARLWRASDSNCCMWLGLVLGRCPPSSRHGCPLTVLPSGMGRGMPRQSRVTPEALCPGCAWSQASWKRQIGSSAWTGSQDASSHSCDSRGLHRTLSRGLTGFFPDVPQPMDDSLYPTWSATGGAQEEGRERVRGTCCRSWPFPAAWLFQLERTFLSQARKGQPPSSP